MDLKKVEGYEELKKMGVKMFMSQGLTNEQAEIKWNINWDIAAEKVEEEERRQRIAYYEEEED